MSTWRLGAFFFCVFVTKCICSTQFDIAVENHKNNNFSDAEQLYCALPIKTSSVIFNMGLLAYHQQSYAKAIGLWRLACVYTTIGNSFTIIKRALEAIDQVKKEQQVPVEWIGHPMDSTQITWHLLFLLVWHLQVIPLWIIQLLFILCSTIIVIALLQTFKKNIKSGKIIVSIGLGIIVLCIMLYDIKVRTASYGVVQQKVALKKGPDEFFEDAEQISVLTEVLIKEKYSSWYKIQYQEVVGWLPEDTIYWVDHKQICGMPLINWSIDH
ncbi:hypothetical protein EKK58_05075 [Candidatus Dependentiae bacterium]|nr:MAG: hypothetical protein EKK58_05075 [Candidatus Dependentiae bacterium]